MAAANFHWKSVNRCLTPVSSSLYSPAHHFGGFQPRLVHHISFKRCPRSLVTFSCIVLINIHLSENTVWLVVDLKPIMED